MRLTEPDNAWIDYDVWKGEVEGEAEPKCVLMKAVYFGQQRTLQQVATFTSEDEADQFSEWIRAQKRSKK